jgi:hypothetical protein
VTKSFFRSSLQHVGLQKRDFTVSTEKGGKQLNWHAKGEAERGAWLWWETSMVHGSWDQGSPSTSIGIFVLNSIFIWWPWANLFARESPT